MVRRLSQIFKKGAGSLPGVAPIVTDGVALGDTSKEGVEADEPPLTPKHKASASFLVKSSNAGGGQKKASFLQRRDSANRLTQQHAGEVDSLIGGSGTVTHGRVRDFRDQKGMGGRKSMLSSIQAGRSLSGRSRSKKGDGGEDGNEENGGDGKGDGGGGGSPRQRALSVGKTSLTAPRFVIVDVLNREAVLCVWMGEEVGFDCSPSFVDLI